MILWAVPKVLEVVPGRKRNMSQRDTCAVEPSPALEIKPNACPISCAATATKSIAPESMPSSGLKSKAKFLLKEMVATTSSGFNGKKPSGWVKERDIETTDPSTVSFGITEVGSELYIPVSPGLEA